MFTTTTAICRRLKLDNVLEDSDAFFNGLEEYLFSDFVDNEPISQCLRKLVDAYVEFLKAEDKMEKIPAMNDCFYDLLRTDLFLLSSREKCFNSVQAMQSKALVLFTNDHDRVIVNDVFSKYFRRMTFSSTLPANVAGRRNERMQGVINRQVGEVFLIENEREIPYEQLLGSLKGIGFKKSLLYLFQGNIKNYGTADWMPPASILLKAVLDDEGLRALPEDKQLLRIESIFQNEFIKGDGRRTMIVAPMFVGADIYGLLVIELDMTRSYSLSSAASQLSVTLRSLFMIEEQNKVKQSLQMSLERFIRDNTKLEEIAQKDELTRLYNRRGFIANSEKQLDDPVNQDKVAVICYADMDNLKMINDKFGHDDGDFALCTSARILHESFRDSDVIGRFGGDEFVTFAITGSDIDVAKLKARIDMVTKRYNDEVQKPYPIEMSTGIYKFTITGKIDIYEILNYADELLYQEKIAKKTARGEIK